ncbi:Polysaccharide deacetylase [Ectothiorhodospira magna]|uniref:Polysaccharide deacetylase n=1 Tax=Ectothiorhodospira magna TaxID=867345 RepID=A0A1H9GQL5_9GAMM|nr:polysaccharide deacetylase family protein [Ectothiorhodospira magna]SEQ52340.1 Polysaccharide deacetylase [Ectothiorhodospira magna]
MTNQQTVPHGIMFHHFHDERHVNGQGTISAKQLEQIIEYYGDRLLPAKEWFSKAKANCLAEKDVCLTFDDALLCQYDIALPVLEKYSLTAFWFVYSSVLAGGIEKLEVYRKFRTVCFSSIDQFYNDFFSTLEETEYQDMVAKSLENYSHENWSNFPFYTKHDTKFRFIRDTTLGVERYNKVMDVMIKKHNIDITDFSSDLWMSVDNINTLADKNHIIGLHSHTHPTQLSMLSVQEQENEYRKNFDFLREALGQSPKTVSHPCNSYSTDTFSILRNLKIEIGFRANMENHLFSEYEFPREDHANIIRRIEQ